MKRVIKIKASRPGSSTRSIEIKATIILNDLDKEENYHEIEGIRDRLIESISNKFYHSEINHNHT